MKTTHYHADTIPDVRSVVENLLQSGRETRIRIWYGDTTTGRSWNDENDITGYVGRSTGEKPIPLLVHSRRSYGGGGLLDNCIIRIDTTGGKTLYKHKLFNTGAWSIAPGHNWCNVFNDGNCVASFATIKQANNYISFMKGERYSK